MCNAEAVVVSDPGIEEYPRLNVRVMILGY